MATPSHGLKATLKLGATQLEGTLDSIGMDLQREVAEARHMGDKAVLRLAGLRSCTFSAEGDYDATIDAALYTAWDGDAAVEAIYSPDGTVTYTIDVVVGGYSHRAASNGMVRITVALSSSGEMVRA
jgi:hypothetical protein